MNGCAMSSEVKLAGYTYCPIEYWKHCAMSKSLDYPEFLEGQVGHTSVTASSCEGWSCQRHLIECRPWALTLLCDLVIDSCGDLVSETGSSGPQRFPLLLFSMVRAFLEGKSRLHRPRCLLSFSCETGRVSSDPALKGKWLLTFGQMRLLKAWLLYIIKAGT